MKAHNSKSTVSCDDVFETLTAGPVRSGSETAKCIVEHIDECLSCRELANALRPACHLIHEALPASERGELPVFFRADDVAVQRVMQKIELLEPNEASAARVEQPRGEVVRRLVFVLAVGATLLMLLFWNQSTARDVTNRELAALPLWQMNLPADCGPEMAPVIARCGRSDRWAVRLLHFLPRGRRSRGAE